MSSSTEFASGISGPYHCLQYRDMSCPQVARPGGAVPNLTVDAVMKT
jgi:hypothetical protein